MTRHIVMTVWVLGLNVEACVGAVDGGIMPHVLGGLTTGPNGRPVDLLFQMLFF